MCRGADDGQVLECVVGDEFNILTVDPDLRTLSDFEDIPVRLVRED